jgi:3'-5' exoribonuclease
MKSVTVDDLRSGKANAGLFLVQSKDIREGKTGRKYMSLSLADRTGDIDARVWDNVESYSALFERDDIIRVEGEVQEYQGKTQLIVHRIRKAEEAEIDLQDFLPASRRDRGEMWAELLAIVALIGNPHLKALLEAVLGDERIATAFRTAPAAKTVHHAWLGGLLEHVLSLCGLARRAAEHYAGQGYPIDADLLLTGTILHDLGKTEELYYERSFGYSTAGQLLGHIVIGTRMIEEKLRTLPEFPPKLRMLLEHMILSHHGQLEFGSPKLPQFLEALLLAQIDNLDSKMATMLGSIGREREPGSDWTGYNPAIERQVLDKVSFLADRPAAAQPAAPSAESNASAAKPAANAGRRGSTALGSALAAALVDKAE